MSESIGVAVPTRDRPDSLRRLLLSLAEGTRMPEEIVVVDQGDPAVTRSLLGQFAGLGVPVTHVLDDGRGLSRSRNRALAESTAAIVAFIDDDCVASARWLEAIAQGFAQDGGLTAVTGPVLPLGPERPGLYAVSSRTSREQRAFRGDVLPWLVGTGGNLAIRRSRLEPARTLFDTRLGAGSPGHAGEDLDLLRRLLRGGHVVLYARDAVVLHERQTLDRRMRSRFGYGRGVGAALALWARSRDAYAVHTLGAWFALRGGILLTALRTRNRRGSREELLVAMGTLSGLVYGARAKDPERTL